MVSSKKIIFNLNHETITETKQKIKQKHYLHQNVFQSAFMTLGIEKNSFTVLRAYKYAVSLSMLCSVIFILQYAQIKIVHGYVTNMHKNTHNGAYIQ